MNIIRQTVNNIAAYDVVIHYTILIGNNIVNILSSSLTTVLFTKKFGSNSVAYATLVMTVLVLILSSFYIKRAIH